ncbi:bifunctional D-glycero-beta-D-manno-heptose-7-phosphate kinase/D-glycero-beta-D-manno-heptose 1-phosphate adenylyltransferase HldE [Pelotalea chapellei]|uniref:Bifunctional protein HldE n=1 Tax=Pelotalea chapellei TaxID=44671 RepID=A0ABS5U4Q3_9BACT|nr:bifunctional D-glycero-beta-D-manno-heptose-7-phosphate kinase/D-glycero-beta-D-manno-heptose 1-phosphate adenylyltransferase HldE [Pelotalea chapellei]MBT1070651.1 bifunctional D-glycero-beta-D-manno-heptose-7-phosphate kinase/D-glycero-beta-D-manno-heptose 1-phosphate adenylyltransferase HldE [Pelotalea chapellei]
MDRKTVESLFQHIGDITCLVVGDLMLDEYLWGKAERISPEAPVQVVDIVREELRLGGAGNVVNNLVALGAQVQVCSVVGDDDNGWSLIKEFNRRNVTIDAIFKDPERRTSRKTRVVAANQQIVRIDRESRDPISDKMEQQVCEWITGNISRFKVVLLSDYLKGVLTPRVVATIISAARSVGIPVLVDPKGDDYTRYHGATLLTPNRKEAETAARIPIRDNASLDQAARKIMETAGLDHLLITRSEEGMSLFLDSGAVHIPTVAREVFDVSGAGDTVLASLAIGIAAGMGTTEAARLANVAAGIAVGKLGTSTVSADEIISAVALVHSDSDSKIKNRDVLTATIATEKARGKRIVFTNGCFDLLHAGHVKYLQKARNLGDLLVLGLNSDASVRRLKGENRPLIGEEERAHILAALNCIDYVVIFDEDTPLELITALRPDILVKGGDYTPEGVVGKEVVEAYGGRVELVSFVDGKSTTNIIERVLERYS